MTKLNARRIAAMFSANSQLDVWPRLSSKLYSYLHKLSNAVLVKAGERIAFKNLFAVIVAQELGGVVATESKRHL